MGKDTRNFPRARRVPLETARGEVNGTVRLMSTFWKIRQHTHDLSARGWIMGVLNVTPDSFSDGGCFADADLAVEHGLRMVEEGAAILDVGGESTRPGATAVPSEEEQRRVVPVIASLRAQTDVLISVDTMKPAVAQAALDAPERTSSRTSTVCAIRRWRGVAARTEAGVIVMHMKGTPGTMQAKPRYDDVVAEVRAFFDERLAALTAAGIAPARIAFDPGIGFGKNLDHNPRPAAFPFPTATARSSTRRGNLPQILHRPPARR